MHFAILAMPEPTKGDQPPASPGGGLGQLLPIFLVLMVVLLFAPLLSRKERTRQKRVQALKKYDRVVTSGGLYGTVISFDEATATLEVAKGVRLTFKRSSIYDIEKAEGAPPEPEKPTGAKG
jgi:preprotein translocase subunit YajC